MKPWMMALAASRREPVTLTFTSSATWTAPVSTSMLVSLVGKGQDGTPASGDSSTTYYLVTLATTFYNRRDGGVDVGETSEVSREETTAGAPVPPTNTQGPFATDDDPVYSSFSIQYQYVKESETVDTTVPATTGANTTGFGKTFAGGAGVAAVAATYANVAVTPGAPYSLTIPSGGYITITYYK